MTHQQPKLSIIGVHCWVNKRFHIPILGTILKLSHGTHGGHFITKHGRVTREDEPRVHKMVTDLQSFIRHSRPI